MKLNTTRPIILASASSRRRKLLQRIIRNFSVIPSLFDESSVQLSAPEDYVKTLSLRKTDNIAKVYPSNWIIGADTIVTLEGDIIGKPHNRENATLMLKRLSGKTHRVYTGYTIRCTSEDVMLTNAVSTYVEFKKINEHEIERYVSTGEPFDKSGGYALQGRGSFIVKKINGSYTNVIGLPMCEVFEDLSKMNIIKIKITAEGDRFA